MCRRDTGPPSSRTALKENAHFPREEPRVRASTAKGTSSVADAMRQIVKIFSCWAVGCLHERITT